MSVVSMRNAKSNLSRLVAQVENGATEEIIIARNGKPAAKLVPMGSAPPTGKRLGLLAGRFPPMSRADFDAPNKIVADLFSLRGR